MCVYTELADWQGLNLFDPKVFSVTFNFRSTKHFNKSLKVFLILYLDTADIFPFDFQQCDLYVQILKVYIQILKVL